MFNEDIFHEIQRVWLQDQRHPFRGRKEKPIPNINDLRTIIEVSFFASLRREEDRPLTFAIALLPKWEVAGSKQIIMPFNESLPFTVDSIQKLSPAFDHNISALIVGPKTEERKDYELWGAMYYHSSPKYYQQIPVGIEFIFRPDVLMVTVTMAGSLLFSRGNSQLCRFVEGRIIPSVPTPFSSKAMGNYIIEIIKNDFGFKNFEYSYWHEFRSSIEHLLSETSLRGHGSTIILLPNDFLESYASKYITKYEFKDRLRIEELIIQRLSYSDVDPIYTLTKLALGNLIIERLSVLSQLSCIDGALLLTNKLRVVSFGATLNANEWHGDVILGPDGFGGGGQKYNVEALGTRHNSAINFIGECPRALGFVISQDGMIRGLVRKDEHTILCWLDCMVSMFV